MGSSSNNNLFLKPSPVLFGKALHGSSTDITDYRETSASIKWKVRSFMAMYLPASCQFVTFFEQHIKHCQRKQRKAQVIWVTLVLQCDNREMILQVGFSQSHSG